MSHSSTMTVQLTLVLAPYGITAPGAASVSVSIGTGFSGFRDASVCAFSAGRLGDTGLPGYFCSRNQKWLRKSEQRDKWKLWVYCRTEGGLETRSF